MSLFGTKLPFAAVQQYGRFRGYSGPDMLTVRISAFDPERKSGWLVKARLVVKLPDTP